MSSHEPPNDAPRERWSDEDPTRYQDAPPQHGDAFRGRPSDEDRTQHLDAVDADAPGRQPLEATVHHRQAAPAPAGAYDDPARRGQTGRDPYGDEPPDEPGRRWGKGTALVLLGLVLGFLIALVVVALGTEDTGTTDVESNIALDRVDELEAELAERDARIDDLEARLAEADADAGEADDAIAAQRDALDERAAELDARSGNLADREAAVVERERQVEAREAAVAERERAADEGEPPPDDDGDGGFELPDIDDEDVDGFVDQVLERIRDLF